MVLAGPLLGVVLEKVKEFVQLKSSKQNRYINTIWPTYVCILHTY